MADGNFGEHKLESILFRTNPSYANVAPKSNGYTHRTYNFQSTLGPSEQRYWMTVPLNKVGAFESEIGKKTIAGRIIHRQSLERLRKKYHDEEGTRVR